MRIDQPLREKIGMRGGYRVDFILLTPQPTPTGEGVRDVNVISYRFRQ